MSNLRNTIHHLPTPHIYSHSKLDQHSAPPALAASRDSTFRILHAASRFEIKQRKRANSSKQHRLANRLFFGLVIFPFALAICLIGISLTFKIEWLRLISITTLLLSYFGAIANPIISAIIYRKSLLSILRHPFGLLLRNAAVTAEVDIRYLKKLEKKPLDLLELIHLEVKSERDFFERRVSLVVGSIEKIGLGPGLLAALLSLDKIPASLNQWAQPIAYAIFAFYLLGAIAHFLLGRLERMCKLLELVINRKKTTSTNQPPGHQRSSFSISIRAARSSAKHAG